MSGLVGATSSIPHTAATDGKTGSSVHRPPMWGGEAAPTRPLLRHELAGGRTELVNAHAFRPIESPELRAAFVAAHFAWARATAPWLLKEWENE